MVRPFDSLSQNVVGARDYIDQVSTEVEELEKLVDETTQSIGRESAQKQVRRDLSGFGIFFCQLGFPLVIRRVYQFSWDHFCVPY